MVWYGITSSPCVTSLIQLATSRRPLYACFVDLQKAYDTVQHHLLWDKLESIGVGPRMLAAIRSLYWHSLDEGGWHGWRALDSANGCSSRLPSSPTLFGLFFDDRHEGFMTTCFSVRCYDPASIYDDALLTHHSGQSFFRIALSHYIGFRGSLYIR